MARAPDGRVVFVRHSLPGERVVARVTATTASFLRADAVEILTPSPDRVPPPCPHAGPGRCGGCDFQHVELGAQRRLKAFRVAEQLARRRRLERTVEVEPVDGDVGGLRWRSRVRVAVDGNGAVGFRRHRSHELEPVDDCPIAAPAVAATGALASPVARASRSSRSSRARAPGEAVVSVTPRGRGRAAPARRRHRIGLVVRGRWCAPPAPCTPRSGGAPTASRRASSGRSTPAPRRRCSMRSSPWSATAAARAVVDLYAGAGLFSVPLAEAAGPEGSVLAVERDARACADARHNGAGRANLAVTRADGDAPARGDRTRPPRRRRARPRPGGRRHDGHAGARRARGHACAGSSTSRATRPRSPATSASCSTRAGASPNCAPSTSSP